MLKINSKTHKNLLQNETGRPKTAYSLLVYMDFDVEADKFGLVAMGVILAIILFQDLFSQVISYNFSTNTLRVFHVETT